MKPLFFFMILISVNITFAQQNKVERELDSLKKEGHKIVTMKFNYNNIACTCAQWSASKFNGKRYMERVYTYFEPANDSIAKIITVDDFPFQVKVTGIYLTQKGYPKDFKQTKGFAGPAAVFRVYKAKVLKRG